VDFVEKCWFFPQREKPTISTICW